MNLPYCRCRESLSGLDGRRSQPQHSFKPRADLERGPSSPQFCEAEGGERAEGGRVEAGRGSWSLGKEAISIRDKCKVKQQQMLPEKLQQVIQTIKVR